MDRNNSNSKKGPIMTAIAVILIGIIIAVVIFLFNRDQDTFEYEGWIDCMPSPMPSPERDDLCRRAEAANYPYIAY